MINFIIYKNCNNYQIFYCKRVRLYMLDLVQLSRKMNYANSNYLINYYFSNKQYIKNNFYYNNYTDLDGLEIILSRSRKVIAKSLLNEIKQELK